MRTRIDSDRCTGHGRCYSLAPEVYEPDDEGHGQVLIEEIPPHLQDEARRAASECPEQAVVLE